MRAHTVSNNQAFVTISIDDGHPEDLRVAELLTKYNLAATFYMPVHNSEQPVMSSAQMRELARRFEVGGHTMNHVALNGLPESKVWSEISDGKAWLEDTLGKPLESFCYPMGKHNARIAALVKKAGFLGARTCWWNRHEFPHDPFAWGVSTQAHNHSKAVQVRHAILEQNFRGLLNFLSIYKSATDWATHFGQALEHVQAKGGVAHLYLHSWEISECGEWEKLESVFRLVSQQPAMHRVTNGELFAMWGVRNRVVEVTEAGGLAR